MEQLYTSLGIPPPPKGTIVAQDYAKEYQAKEKEKRNSILDNSNKNKETYGKIKEKKRVRFHCPVPNTEIHASDLYFVLSKKNVFDKLKKITPKGDFQNVLDSPKLLRESLIELGFEDGVGNKEYEDLKERKKRFKMKRNKNVKIRPDNDDDDMRIKTAEEEDEEEKEKKKKKKKKKKTQKKKE